MSRKPRAFDVRIISKPVKVLGIRVSTKLEPVLLLSFSATKDTPPELFLVEMTDKGLAITMENRQLSGELSYRGWAIVDTFRIGGFAFHSRLREMLGRKAPRKLKGNATVTTAQAIAYIFDLPDWEKATVEVLRKARKADDDFISE
jgi:hypothetical protein